MRKLEEIIRELPENIREPIYEAFIAFRDDIILKETREIKAEIGRVWEVIKEIAESQRRTEQEIEKIWSAIKELTEYQKRTEQEIEKIWGAIKELAEAQKRTEQRVSELAEAQKRTEQEIEKIWVAIKELTESQKRTEQEIEKIWDAIKELTEAQKRTEQRVEELAQAQKETEQKIKELTEAQKETEQKIKELTEAQRKTEESLKKLIEDHSKTREKLEGLSHSFGYLLEDRAMKSLPKILKRKYNIKAVGNFVRDYFIINGEHVEVNIFGRVRKGNKEYILIGEAKSQVTKKAIDKFLKKCDKISRSFSKETIKVFISYIFPPGIKEYAEEKGIVLIPSYELDL